MIVPFIIPEDDDYVKPNAMALWLAAIAFSKFKVPPKFIRPSVDDGVVLSFGGIGIDKYCDIEVFNNGQILTAIVLPVTKKSEIKEWTEETIDEAVKYLEDYMYGST